MTKDKNELMGSLKREKKRNYVILYTVTLVVWLLLVAYSFLKGFFNGEEFVVNVVNNIIGILPPILIFDFFNEKLTKESDTIEMSNQITETLMSNPETLELFSEEQKKNFIRSAVSSVVRDPDAADMLNDTLAHYLSGKVIGKIRTSFDYDFVLEERLPAVYETLLEKQENYFYVQEKLCYTVKYLEEWEEDEEWKNAYWSIDQYCRDNVKESDIFALPKYTYIAKCNGDIQYFKHRSNKKPRNFEERYKLLVEENFGMRSVDLNIPVPYCPGDILKIEYSPYIFEPHYCILTEVGDGCCSIQCLYVCPDGHIENGALKHGEYFPNNIETWHYLSPLYGSKVYTGKLPEECAFMKKLSDKLHKNPDFGKTVWEMKNYFELSVR